MRRRKSTKPSTESLMLAKLDAMAEKAGVALALRLNAAEMERDRAVAELNFIKDKLTGMLTEDQLEAARVCGCAPAVYALELIDLWRMKAFPSFTPGIEQNGSMLRAWK